MMTIEHSGAAPGARRWGLPLHQPAPEREGRARRFPECLGPMPQAALACFVDLGLSDLDIARYFKLDLLQVAALTRPIRAAMPI